MNGESRKVLLCPKCGSEIEIVENQTIGHCTLCDSLIPLPSFIVKADKVTPEQYKNMLNRINKAIEYSQSFQFHRAFNLYDKLHRNNFNLNIKDSFPYFGKFLNQYGVTYVINDTLQFDLVCMNVLKESIYENENYQKALSSSDANIQAILKKEAASIDNFQKDIRKELIKASPIDVCILINKKDIDNSHVKVLKEKLDAKNIVVKVLVVDFEKITKQKVIEQSQVLSMAKHLVIFAETFGAINNTMYRNTWMTYLQDDEIQKAPADHITIFSKLTDDLQDLPIKDLPHFTLDELDKAVNHIKDHLTFSPFVKNEEYQDLWNLIDQECFDDVRMALNHKLKKASLEYEGWLLLFLAKHKIKNLDELDSLVINPLESYYFQRTYMYAGRCEKAELFKHYERIMEKWQKLAEVDEDYEKEVLDHQAKIYKHATVKIFLLIIPILIATLISFWTLSVANAFETILMVVLNGIAYMYFFINFTKNMNMGRIPNVIKDQNSEENYFLQLKKLLDAKNAAKYIPGKKTNRMHLLSIIALCICLIFSGAYLTKEIVVRVENRSINYYYVFNTVYVNGGNKENVYIPEKIGGKDVLGITKEAFKNNQYLRTVKIENGLSYIESNAFDNCQNLVKVDLPKSIVRVIDAPFSGCTSLEEFTYRGNRFRPADFLGNDYRNKMPNLNYKNE